MLVRHVHSFVNLDYLEFNRTRQDFGLVATIVALGPNQIGVAIHNPLDKATKKRGIEVASGRAIKYNVDDYIEGIRISDSGEQCPLVPTRWVGQGDDVMLLKEVLKAEVERMKQRASKYFQTVAVGA
jgi:hypothetical protein